jgi:hypothetical protein
MANLFKTLDSKREEYVKTGNVQALSVLSRLEGYVEGGNYTKYKYASKFYAYRNLTAKDVGLLLSISPETVKRSRHTLSKECWSVIGEDFFTNLDNGEVDKCNSILDFLLGDYVGTTLLPTGIVSLVESVATAEELNSVKEEHNLSTYIEEVNFLVSISSPYIKAKISNLNIGNLLYAIRVLEGKVGSPSEHANLVNYIMERSGEEL